MKYFTIVFISIAYFADAQNSIDLLNLKPDSAVTGIKIQKIASDQNSSSFIIWVNDVVKAHKHLTHTENIYVLDGEGEMKIGGNVLKIKDGDYINVPPNTVHSLKVLSPIPMKVLSIQSPEFFGDDRVFVDE